MKLLYREAKETDLPDLIEMLADDTLGKKREDTSRPINQRYIKTLSYIIDDPNNELIVVEYENQLAGMLQLTFIPYLSHMGSWRCLIESVRVQGNYRGRGLGSKIFEWAIQRAKDKHCNILQLTSDKKRPEAIRFYENLGFVPSHEGLKLKL